MNNTGLKCASKYCKNKVERFNSLYCSGECKLIEEQRKKTAFSKKKKKHTIKIRYS